jgi:hypothetical protein
MIVVVISRAFRRLKTATDCRKSVVVRHEKSKPKPEISIVPSKVIMKRQHRDDTSAFIDRFQEQIAVLLGRVEFNSVR